MSNNDTPAGWKLVPVEPTPEMIGEIESASRIGVVWTAASVYAAMLAAAPQPPAAPQPVAQGDVRDAEAELNCAEEVLDGYAVGLDLEQTHFDCIGDYITAVVGAALVAAPAGVVGEPVAWMNSENQRDPIGAEKKRDLETINGAPGRALAAKYTVPLYTAPPARQALTDSRLHEIWQASWHGPSAGRDYGRAVMRACAEAWGVTLVGIGGKGGADHG